MGKNRPLLHRTSLAARLLPAASLLWAVCYAVLALVRLIPLEQLIVLGDIYQLVLGFGAMAVLFARMKSARRKYVFLGTGLAVFSWTAGQLFWFSYTLLMDSPLPYPSVGDLGFTGAYFFLIGVIGLLGKNAVRSPFAPLAFLLLLVPAWLAFSQSTSAVKLYNVVLGSAAAYTLYKVLPLAGRKSCQWFFAGIILLVFTDVLFMVSVVYFRDSFTLTSAPLYPLALSILSYGVLKGKEDDT